MKFGHCKNCWWWNKTKTIADKGYCFFHRNTTKETTYCIDYYNRELTQHWRRCIFLLRGKYLPQMLRQALLYL